MPSLFRWALASLAVAILTAAISIALGNWLLYTSYLSLFNTLALIILLFILASFSLSVAGLLREKLRRYRFIILMAVNLLFLIWVVLE